MLNIYTAIIIGVVIGYLINNKKGFKELKILEKSTTITILTLIFIIGIGIGRETTSIKFETINTIIVTTILNIVIPIIIEVARSHRGK